MRKKNIAIFIIIFTLIVDQWSKIWIKTNMALGDEIRITNWFIIHFTENPGMAFGWQLGGDYGKLALTLFRLIAITLIFLWLKKVITKNKHSILIIAISLIFSGALGNILDSVFYGVLFNHSDGQIASFLPDNGGYANILFGKVVDMLYLPLWKGFLPDWLPFWGGDYFIFFQPIFNLADTAISIGFGLLIIFNKTISKELI